MKISGKILNLKKNCKNYSDVGSKEEFVRVMEKDDWRGDNYFLVMEGCFGYGIEENYTDEFKRFKIRGVIAKNFTQMQYRNLINSGILPIKQLGYGKIEDNSDVEIDLENWKILYKLENKTIDILPIHKTIIEIYKAGGLLNFDKKNIFKLNIL